MQQQLIALVRLTFADPRAAGAALLSNIPDRNTLLLAAAFVSVLGVMFSWVFIQFSTGTANPLAENMVNNPILFAVAQFMVLIISVMFIHIIGRAFGGIGSFDQSLVLSVWLQFYMMLIQAVLVFVAIISVSLTSILNIGAYVYFVWLLVNFIAILHGFRSLWKVFAGLVATSFAFSSLVLMLLGMLGIAVEGA